MKNNSKSDFLINQSKVFLSILIGGGKFNCQYYWKYKGVDWWRYESKFEHICTLNYLQKLNLKMPLIY